ncbi:MAG: MATE family efflux transporter [Lachnospiraceae bacterium]|nr:MATE family efflux transporter [Lachnospiraceae bacterium]
MTENQDMTKGQPLKLLFFFALPLMFGNVFQHLYTVADTAIVGQGVGMDALAALGSVDWLNWLFLGTAQGFPQGFAVLVSQKYGERDLTGMKAVIGSSARLSILIAVAGLVMGEMSLPLFLQVLRVPAEVRGLASLYMRILLGGFPATVFFNYCSSVLRAVGDSRTPLLAMTTAAVTNVVLDWIVVFEFGWGIAGAAGATVFSQCFSGLWCAGKIYRTSELHFGRAHLKKNRGLERSLMKIGLPVAGKNLMINLGGMVVQTIVNGFGMSFIAGFTATNKLYGLLETAAVSYGYAVTTYVGQNYGAGKIRRIREGVRTAVFLSLVTSLAITIVMLVFGRDITMVFISSQDPMVAAKASDTACQYLYTMSVCLSILYILHVYLAALQGMGHTLLTMEAGLIEFGMRVGAAVLVGLTGFAPGIFGAEVAAWLGSTVFLIPWYYRKLSQAEITMRE